MEQQVETLENLGDKRINFHYHDSVQECDFITKI